MSGALPFVAIAKKSVAFIPLTTDFTPKTNSNPPQRGVSLTPLNRDVHIVWHYRANPPQQLISAEIVINLQGIVIYNYG
jgi:hypothetical protein